MEVRIVQDEVDTRHIGLQEVAGVVCDWDHTGWRVDLQLETHTEGAGPNVRGVFGIYPDWGNDIDGDARRIAEDAAQRIGRAVGIRFAALAR